MGRNYKFYDTSKVNLNIWRKDIGKFCIYTNFDKDYKLSNKIGEGSFSQVYEAYKLRGFKRVAVKIVSKKQLMSRKAFAVKLHLIGNRTPFCTN